MEAPAERLTGRVGSVLVMLLGIACGDATSAGGTGGSARDGSGGSPPVCNEGPPPSFVQRCNARIDVEAEDVFCRFGAMNDGREPRILDLAQAACVLTALRDRTCGDLTVDLTPDGFGFCGERATLSIDGDIARRKHETYLDKHDTVTEGTFRLALPDDYQACLDGDEARQVACLTELVR